MSNVSVFDLLEEYGLPGRFLRSALSEPLGAWLNDSPPTSLFLVASWPEEGQRVLEALARLLQDRHPRLRSAPPQEAGSLLQHLRAYGPRALRFLQGEIVILRGLEMQPPDDRAELWSLLQRHASSSQVFLGFLPSLPPSPEASTLASFFPQILALPPLYQRGLDIDTVVFYEAKALFAKLRLSQIKGFSLEAAAHLHRAILQTRRDTADLAAFLHTLGQRVLQGSMPLEDGTLLAWPILRLLEEEWGYNLLRAHQNAKENLAHLDLQGHLFSASLEQAAQKSGFSRDVIEMQILLLQRMIHELPLHQRNYQGLTSSLDHLAWLSMKLLSGARTQSEMRDFFGFRSEGKIPKATAKLKFDQYHLEEYGFRACDPPPWAEDDDPSECTPLTELPPPTPSASVIQLFPSSRLLAIHASEQAEAETPLTSELSTPKTAPSEDSAPSSEPYASAPPAPPEARHQMTVQGEVAETLFWRYQDLFAVLAGDRLSLAQIAQVTQTEPHAIREEIELLVKQGLLRQEGPLFSLPSQDMYYKHNHSRFLEENLLHVLAAAFSNPETSVLENSFYRFPAGGLPRIRESILQPFLSQQIMPRSDLPVTFGPNEPYPKKMGAFLLLGTSRVTSGFQTRIDLQERILHYFREAYLQRASERHKHQAICLQATMMLLPAQMDAAAHDVRWLRSRLRSFLPQGRGIKPNFNLTLCFTEIPLRFSREAGSQAGLIPSLVGVSR